MAKKKPLPKDKNQLAKKIVDLATDKEDSKKTSTVKPSPKK